jgi:hypothetical protein
MVIATKPDAGSPRNALAVDAAARSCDCHRSQRGGFAIWGREDLAKAEGRAGRGGAKEKHVCVAKQGELERRSIDPARAGRLPRKVSTCRAGSRVHREAENARLHTTMRLQREPDAREGVRTT